MKDKTSYRSIPACLQCLSIAHVSPSVEELQLITTLVPKMSNGNIWEGNEDIMMRRVALDDSFLAKALVPEITPGLRVVRVLFRERIFSSQFLKDFSARAASTLGEEISSEAQFEFLLPECFRVCKERGIEFIVDMLFDKESWI